nr:MAG TPA: hypothetical protein [Caudoviricetes sp.]
MGTILVKHPFDGDTSIIEMQKHLNALYRSDTDVRDIVLKWCDISTGSSSIDMSVKSSNLSGSKLYQDCSNINSLGIRSYLYTGTKNPQVNAGYSYGGADLTVDLDINNPAIYFIDSEYGFGIGVGTCKPLIGVLKGHTIDGVARDVMFRTQNYVSHTDRTAINKFEITSSSINGSWGDVTTATPITDYYRNTSVGKSSGVAACQLIPEGSGIILDGVYYLDGGGSNPPSSGTFRIGEKEFVSLGFNLALEL